MAHLGNLPDETLLEILSYLIKSWRYHRCHDNSDLFNAALLSRRFRDLVRPTLVRSVVLDLVEHLTRGDLFARSVQENPAVASMVYELELRWQEGDQDRHSKVNHLLGQLQNLKFLSINAGCDKVPFEPIFLDSGSMKHLSHLTLEDTSLTTTSMAQYFFHDSLRSLNILWVEERDVLPILPRGYTHGTSPLLHLTLSPMFHLAEDVLCEILGWPAALESLRCGQTGKDIPDPWHWRSFDMQRVSTPFSPASVGRALASARDSLKSLCFLHGLAFFEGNPDRSRLDLSMMKELTHIDTRSVWFFLSFEDREEFYRLLPPALEALKLHLGGPGHGITRSEIEHDDEEEKKPCADLLWLMNIVSNKRNYFPRLREIHLNEFCSYEADPTQPWYWELRWKPPRAVARSFQEANITLVASVLKKYTNGPRLD